MSLDEATLDELWAEIGRRKDHEESPSGRLLLQHIARWRAVCSRAHVGGLLQVKFSCERIPDDQVKVSGELTRLNVIWLDAIMRTRNRFKPHDRRILWLQFRQIVPIIATRAERYAEIWKLTDEAYRHEAAELLRVGGRRIARTHLNGTGDATVQPP